MLTREDLKAVLAELILPEFEAVQDRLDEQSVHLMTLDLQLEAIRTQLETRGRHKRPNTEALSNCSKNCACGAPELDRVELPIKETPLYPGC